MRAGHFRIASAMAAGAITLLGTFLVAAGTQDRSEPVFTSDQAATGKVAFSKHCASCHMPDLSGDNDVPQLAGANFMNTWRRRSTRDLLDYMSTAMPPGG